MKEILNRLVEYKTLNENESKEILIRISNGELNNSQISSFLTVFMMRNITLEELKGFRDALLELCLKVNLEEFDTIDLCGTGGDGKNTFNISTISSFVVAGAGYTVTKHGNYGVSSGCGSSNVLEFLGIKFSNDYDFLRKCIDESNITFLHAPLFHPAMKNVAPVRKSLGFKTFFNVLGPLVNPCQPKNQITGVYSLDLARLYGHIFRNTDKNFSVLYSLDGYDEVSLTNEFKLINNKSEQILDYSYFDLKKLKQNQIEGGSDIVSSAKIFMDVLNDNCTEAQKNVILANAALAIKTISSKNITECLSIAKESLESKKALNSFNKLLSISK
jgi:anthranilate phosphoribosyltransferase